MNSARLIKKNRSSIDKLKSKGPTIEPCGTPEMISTKLLYMLFIRTHCFLSFKLNQISFKAESHRLSAANLATIKSCGMKSNALENLLKLRQRWNYCQDLLPIVLLCVLKGMLITIIF